MTIDCTTWTHPLLLKASRTPCVANRTRLYLVLSIFLLGMAKGYAGDAIVTITDPVRNHVHAPGSPFQILVSVTDPGGDGPIYYQWINPADEALSEKQVLVPEKLTPISSPSGDVGHYRLRFTSSDPRIRFPPQDAGYHMDYGFSILPAKDLAARKLDLNSPFGMVHADHSDPYIAGYSKTLTWQPSPARIAKKLTDARSHGLEETLMVSGKGWDSGNSDNAPITTGELNRIGKKLGAILDELKRRGISDLGILQAGREENRGKMARKSYFVANLESKLARLRDELNKRSLKTKIIISFVGAGPGSLAEEKAILHSGAGKYIDIVGQDPYPWKTDFAEPETWLTDFLKSLHTITSTSAEGPKRLMLTEFGLPVRGNNNPSGFFGYPDKKVYEPGVTPVYQAIYLVKSHVLAMSTKVVDRIYIYNYQNRGNDIHYAEHHFGLRSYAVDSKGKRVPGFPLPAYSAYATLVDRLGGGREFQSEYKIGDSGRYFVFESKQAVTTSPPPVLVAWSKEPTSVPLAAFGKGVAGRRIDNVIDLFGGAVDISRGSVTLSDKPIYMTLNAT